MPVRSTPAHDEVSPAGSREPRRLEPTPTPAVCPHLIAGCPRSGLVLELEQGGPRLAPGPPKTAWSDVQGPGPKAGPVERTGVGGVV